VCKAFWRSCPIDHGLVDRLEGSLNGLGSGMSE